MALPRIVALTLIRKRTMADGNVLLAFKVKSGEDTGQRGYARLVVSAAAAGDFTTGLEFTVTFTAGD